MFIYEIITSALIAVPVKIISGKTKPVLEVIERLCPVLKEIVFVPPSVLIDKSLALPFKIEIELALLIVVGEVVNVLT
jgi:hypothetical protein